MALIIVWFLGKGSAYREIVRKFDEADKEFMKNEICIREEDGIGK